MKKEDGRSKSQLHRGHVENSTGQPAHVDGRKKKKERGVPTAVEVVFYSPLPQRQGQHNIFSTIWVNINIPLGRKPG